MLSGFRGPIANFVTQNRPDTVEKVLEFARMAELTTQGSSSAENQLADQLDDVKIEMRKFAAWLDRMTSAAVYSEGAQLPVGEQRASSPRRVSFAPEAQYASNQPRSNVNNSWQRSNAQYNRSRRFGPRRNFMPRPAQMGNSGNRSNLWPEQQQFSSCGKCGWRPHGNINECPAINRTCWVCLKPGHLVRACRAAIRGRAAMGRYTMSGHPQQ